MDPKSKIEETKKRLALLFRRFKLDEINNLIIQEFNDLITWSQLKKDAIRCNIRLNQTGISKLLLHHLKDERYEELRKIYNNFLVQDTLLHHKRKQWTAVVLSSPHDQLLLENEWQKSIISSFRKRSKNADVYSSTKDNLRWFVIISNKRTKKNGIVFQNPIFIAVSIQKPFLYFSPKNVKSETLEIIVNGIGYNGFEVCKLVGNDLPTLISMLDNKKNAALIHFYAANPYAPEIEETKNRLALLFRRFKLDEINNLIIQEFNDLITWSQLKKDAIRCNIGLNQTGISKLLLHHLKDERYEELKKIYNNFLVQDTLLHHKRKQWTAVVLSSPHDQLLLENEWQKSIISSFRKRSKNADVYSSTKDNLRWFVIISNKRTKKNGIVFQNPIFIAVSIQKPFLYFSPKNVKSETLEIVVNGIGYNTFKLCKLVGNDLPTLISMLDNKKNAALIHFYAANPYATADVIRSSDGYNHTHDKDRLSYAATRVGNGSILFKSYTINVESDWKGLSAAPGLEGMNFPATLTIRSKNIGESIVHMAEIGAIKHPFPDWLEKFAVSGKNKITVGKNKKC